MEIGTSTIRLAEVAKRGKVVEVLQTHVFDTPDDATRDGKVRISENVVSAIKNGIDGSGIKATDVYFAVESTKILFKSVEVPFVSKKQIQNTLEYSFEDYFPVDKTLYHVSYVPKRKYEKNGQIVILLDVFAIPNDLSESYYNLAVNLGLNAKGLTSTTRGIMNLFPTSFKNRNVAMININENTSTLGIVVDGETVYNKTIPHGIGSAIQHVVNSPLTMDNEDVTSASEHLYANNILFKQMPTGVANPNDETEKLRYNVTNSVVSLIKTIEQHFVAFLSKENIQIQEFQLSGLGAGFSGITNLLESEFSIPVTVIQQDDNLKVNVNAADDTLLLGCYPCIGASLDAANFFTKDEQAGGEITHRKQIDKICMVVGSLVCLVCLGYGTYTWLQAKLDLQDATAENVRLTKRVEDLRELGVEQAYNEYMTALSYNEEVANLYNNTRSGNEDMTVFLAELEQLLPRTSRVTAITLTPSEANVSFVCDNKFTAAGVLHLLRNMKTTNSMDCSGVAESQNTNEISFTCRFNLKTTAQREEDARLEAEQNGGAEIDQTTPTEPTEDDNNQIVDEPTTEYLAESIGQNTDAELFTLSIGGVDVDIRTLTTEILETNGFINASIFALENDAIAIGGVTYANEDGVSLGVSGNSSVEAVVIENDQIAVYNGIVVGMSVEEAQALINNPNVIDTNGYIIIKSAENTLVLKTDFDGVIIESIYLINNTMFGDVVTEDVVDAPSESVNEDQSNVDENPGDDGEEE